MEPGGPLTRLWGWARRHILLAAGGVGGLASGAIAVAWDLTQPADRSYARWAWRELVAAAGRARGYLLATHATPGWLLASLWILGGFGLAVLVGNLLLWALAPRKTEYREEEIEGLVWRWRWSRVDPNYPDWPLIERLCDRRAYCPVCRMRLEEDLVDVSIPPGLHSPGTRVAPWAHYRCVNERCGFEVVAPNRGLLLQQKVQGKIELALDDGRWREVVRGRRGRLGRMALDLGTVLERLMGRS